MACVPNRPFEAEQVQIGPARGTGTGDRSSLAKLRAETGWFAQFCSS